MSAIINKPDSEKKIEGYLAVYNKHSRPITERGQTFLEIISTGAFKPALKRGNEIVLTLNHDFNRVLASTKDGSLKLFEDTYGLRFVAYVTNELARNVHELSARGNAVYCSFTFQTFDTEYIEYYDEKRGYPVKRINSFSKIYEGAILDAKTYPAYPHGTSASARSLSGQLEPN